jgi:hypothetical protein
MEPNIEHCLTIAAGFIAIIAACAALITGANTKAESLATRIRAAMKEHRERRQDSSRCTQLEDQICLFKDRFVKVQRAQRFLFATIGILIASLAVFIGLGLYIIYENIPQADIGALARGPIRVIAICVALGTVSMLIAIVYQFLEVGYSYTTLCIETRDCPAANPAEVLSRQSPPMAKGAAG